MLCWKKSAKTKSPVPVPLANGERTLLCEQDNLVHATYQGPGEGSLKIHHQATLPSDPQVVHGRGNAEANEYAGQDHLADWQSARTGPPVGYANHDDCVYDASSGMHG